MSRFSFIQLDASKGLILQETTSENHTVNQSYWGAKFLYFQSLPKQNVSLSKDLGVIFIFHLGVTPFQAEQQLQMVEEQRKIDEERQKIKRAHEKKTREEQKIILGKNNARPKISFSIWAAHFPARPYVSHGNTLQTVVFTLFFSFFQVLLCFLHGSCSLSACKNPDAWQSPLYM